MGEVGDGAGDFDDFEITTSGEIKGFSGAREDVFGWFREVE